MPNRVQKAEKPSITGLFIVSIIEYLYGGGKGTCTPVSKSNTKSIYECSLCFKIRPRRLPKTGFLQNYLDKFPLGLRELAFR